MMICLCRLILRAANKQKYPHHSKHYSKMKEVCHAIRTKVEVEDAFCGHSRHSRMHPSKIINH